MANIKENTKESKSKDSSNKQIKSFNTSNANIYNANSNNLWTKNMVNLNKRQKQDLEVLYFENNTIIRSKMTDVLKKYRIDGLIRFQNEDFKYLQSKTRITHFNIPYSVGRRGKTYGLVRIVDYGSYDMNHMRMPVLDFGKMYKAVCLNTRNLVNYSELKSDDFKYSLKNVKSIYGLKKAMIRRCNKIMPSLSEDQIINMGLSVRDLQIM